VPECLRREVKKVSSDDLQPFDPHQVILPCRSHSACDGGAVFSVENDGMVCCVTRRGSDESFGRRTGTVDSRIQEHGRSSFHLRLGTVGAERYRGQITSGYRR
jgi:hypothetical protein